MLSYRTTQIDGKGKKLSKFQRFCDWMEDLLFGNQPHYITHEVGPTDEMRTVRTYDERVNKKPPKNNPETSKYRAMCSMRQIRRVRGQNIRSGVAT